MITNSKELENILEKIMSKNTNLYPKGESQDEKRHITLSALIWAVSEYSYEQATKYLFKCLKTYIKGTNFYKYEDSLTISDTESVKDVLKNIIAEVFNTELYYLIDLDKRNISEDIASERVDEYLNILDILTERVLSDLSDFVDIKRPEISTIAPYLFSAFTYNAINNYKYKTGSFVYLKEEISRNNTVGKTYKEYINNNDRNLNNIIKNYFDYKKLDNIKSLDKKTYLPQEKEVNEKYAALLGFIRYSEKIKHFNFTLTTLLFERKTELFSICVKPSIARVLFPYKNEIFKLRKENDSKTEGRISMSSLYSSIINDEDIINSALCHINELDILHYEFTPFFCNRKLPNKIEIIDRFIPAYKQHAFYSNSSYIDNESTWMDESLQINERVILNLLDDE